MTRAKSPLVPLGTLIGRELRSEKVENPVIRYGQAALAKKGEDYFLIKPHCQRIPGNPSTSFSVFAVIFASCLGCGCSCVLSVFGTDFPSEGC